MRMHSERERAGTSANAVSGHFAKRSREIGIAMQAPVSVITYNEKTPGTSVIAENSFRRSRSFLCVFARF
jgi:hypothetical protein